MLTFVSRLLQRNALENRTALSARGEAGRDTSVAFVAGQGARVYSLAAYRALKKLQAVTCPTSPAPAGIA
jgi:uroporphyrinogen-III synthase